LSGKCDLPRQPSFVARSEDNGQVHFRKGRLADSLIAMPGARKVTAAMERMTLGRAEGGGRYAMPFLAMLQND
jgi:hypothetical protein